MPRPASAPTSRSSCTRRTEGELTPIGKALRATHLDEIPQLWNVMRGDMAWSARDRSARLLAELSRVHQYWQRLVIRPGVTGLAQPV